jgi:hypothetical protein
MIAEEERDRQNETPWAYNGIYFHPGGWPIEKCEVLEKNSGLKRKKQYQEMM